MTSVLIVPGYANSGPHHWQSLWQAKHPEYQRVNQRNWDAPQATEWVETLNHYIQRAQSPVILVAHSLGCVAVARWAQLHTGNVAAALLVAPVDLDERPNIPAPVVNGAFAPTPLAALPFSSVVVASTSDPCASIARAQLFAEAWGAQFVNVGDCGHLNAEAGFGPWAEGEQLLAGLLTG